MDYMQLTRAQIVFIGGVGLALFFLVVYIGGFLPCPFKANCRPLSIQKELTVWGVFDDSGVWDEAFDQFSNEYQVQIDYKKIPIDEYEKEVIDALASDAGPDVVYLQNSWLPKFKDKLIPFSDKSMSIVDFRSQFMDVVETDFVSDGEIFALPLFLDTLALYYNKDTFNEAGITRPPKTWEEFQEDVKKITRIDATGDVRKSGAAMGAARNINRSTDIVTLLMLQLGARMVDLENNEAKFANIISTDEESFSPGLRALEFYTDFANPLKSTYTWNDTQDYSIDAFYAGKTAMMINYSHHIQTIRDKSPSLNFGIAPVPQPKGQTRIVNYPNYWGLGVTKKGCDDPNLCFEFIKYLTDQGGAQVYSMNTHRPVARRDLVDWQKGDPDIGVFAQQGLTAKSWWQIDNVAIEQIFADMIDKVVKDGEAPGKAVGDAQEQVSLLMTKESSPFFGF